MHSSDPQPDTMCCEMVCFGLEFGEMHVLNNCTDCGLNILVIIEE